MAASDKAIQARLRELHELPRTKANTGEMERLRRIQRERRTARARRMLGLPEVSR